MAIRIQNNRVVRLAYRLTDSDGRLLEDRTPENAFEYVQGTGQVLPSIERIVEGRTAGFCTELQVSPREAYGDYNPALVTEMARDKFPKDIEIHVGMKFNTTGPNGTPITVRVIEMDEKTVTIDGNHPLAGLELIFELRVLEVSEGSPAASNTGADFDPENFAAAIEDFEKKNRPPGSLH
jgi:FKBP-type peptidyl-prolyl cis-trans isomerase SlyD